MTILNVHILNKLYGSEKLSHEEYMLYLANYLLRTGLRDCSVTTPSVRQSNTIEIMHNESAQHWHFIEKIPHVEGNKRKPSRPCFACNGSWEDIKRKQIPKNALVIGVQNVKKLFV